MRPRPVRILLSVLLLLPALPFLPPGLGSRAAEAEGEDPRARILAVEMRRGPVADLEPFLSPEQPAEIRRLAIRALGRIGDRGAAPVLARLLAAGGDDLPVTLWAAGTAQTKDLGEPIALHLLSKDAAVVAAAALALGWTGEPRWAPILVPLLERPEPAIRAAALDSLARLRDEKLLERTLLALSDPQPDVRRAAEFAVWMLAGARRDARLAKDKAWNGAPDLCEALLPLLGSEDPERRMAAVRPLGILLPKDFAPDGPFRVVLDLVEDPDARVVQDVVGRVMTRRQGAAIDAALVRALDHADPKVRHRAAEALGKHGGEVAQQAIAARRAREADLLVREVLAVEAARLGDESVAERLAFVSARPADPVVRSTTQALAFLASGRGDALVDLAAWAFPAEGPSPVPTATWMTILDGLEGSADPAAERLVARLLSPLPEDPYLRSAALSLAAKKGWWAFLPLLLAADAADVARQSQAEALGTLAQAEGAPEGARARIEARLRELLVDPSAFVRASARPAATKAGLKDVPEGDPGQPNEWQGLPRPKRPVLGLDLTQGGPWLTEGEILRLADRLGQARPRFVFETTAGSFALEVEPEAAPVHSVALLLAVEAGVYRKTRWHRVEPNFVIQGGDPLGHGAGDAGYSLPDEISPLRFVRGALGMPKSEKDTGGCQLFVMHSSYRPLDGRYTNYGRVVAGLEVVDAIRVGDAILGARVAD